MASKAAVEDFMAQRSLAIVGVSRSGRKFGNMALKTLREKGYQVWPIHRHAETLEGEHCFPDLKSLPQPVQGVVISVPPAETEQVVREAAAAGIRRVWMQQGAESEAALRFCQENGLSAVHGECILMFAQPVHSVHRFHHWLWRVLGKLPQ